MTVLAGHARSTMPTSAEWETPTDDSRPHVAPENRGGGSRTERETNEASRIATRKWRSYQNLS